MPGRLEPRMTADPSLIARIRAMTTPLQPRPTGLVPRLAPLGGIRAVLFDVYGTLLVSGCGDIGLTAGQSGTEILQQALIAAGLDLKGVAPERLVDTALNDAIHASHARAKAAGTRFPEVDILEIWSEVLQRLGLRADLPARRRIAIEYELRVNAVWPMPGMADLIETLAARGYVLGLVSNAQFYTPLLLEAFLGRPLEAAGVDPGCCGWSYRLLEGKPSPRVFLEALDGLRARHGIDPPRVLYVGNDMRNDIWPAGALGCPTALFAGDERSLRLRENDPDLDGVRPERIITRLPQISDKLLVD